MNANVRLWCCAVALVASGRGAAQETPAVLLQSPVTGSYTDMMGLVEGKVLKRGQPVVLVRPKLPGAKWWVQEPAVPTAPGRFKARAQFGNINTPNGTPFEVLVVLAVDARQAAMFKVGDAFEALPLDIARSQVHVVTLGLPPAPGVGQAAMGGDALLPGANLLPGAAPLPPSGFVLAEDAQDAEGEDAEIDEADRVLLSPAPKEQVGPLHEVRGRAPIATQPIVLVRIAGKGNPWWVQAWPRVDGEGQFAARIRFGSQRTEPGTGFELVVLLPTTRLEARGLTVGRGLKTLPIGMPRSREVRVQRGS